jgi:tRNA-2-methylthio-N6-dimethylallyladenosine synthase
MNKADSERLESAMGQLGLAPSPQPDDADVIVLNSCVVRQSAEDRVIGNLTRLKPTREGHPDRILALMGCMVGPKTDDLQKRFPYVDVFMRPQQFDPLIELLAERLGIDPEGCIGPLVARPAVATYVPIIHGCDKFCTFCIIPYRRGREVSRPVDELVREAEMLVQRGVKEITLLGQNVDSYGHDLPGGPDLGDLLGAVNDVDGLERIRFLTSHPNDMSAHIIDAVADLDKVCEHINLPVQAGDDDVLGRMKRGYTRDDYLRKVDQVRSRIPNVTMSTDVIVGFCGETDAQFGRTLELIEQVEFSKVHGAAYSNRDGTIAARKLQDDVPQDEKKSRLARLEALQESIATRLNAEYAGRTERVLVEQVRGGRATGRNRNDRLVHFDAEPNGTGPGDGLVGQMVDVKIDSTGPWALLGTQRVPEHATAGLKSV